MIAKGNDFPAYGLAGLVPFAGDQQHVAWRKVGNGLRDRFAAIADLAGARRGSDDRAADRRRILAARIVIGNDDDVGLFRGDRAHQRTLAGIAIAAGAEHHDEATLHVRP